MQRLILGAIALLAWMPLAGQPQREDAAIVQRNESSPRRVQDRQIIRSRLTANWARKVYAVGFRARIVIWDFGHEIWREVDFVPEI